MGTNFQDLPAAIALTGAEIVPLVQAGVDKRTTTQDIANLVSAISANIQAQLNGISSTVGSILYRNASAWVALTPGTAGQVLTTQGNGANPTWAAFGLTVGSTAISGGTTTRILYDNAGVVGEYTITGTGTVVAMQTSPSFTTPSLGVASATSITASGLLQAGTTLGISTDVLLNRDAANVLAQRNGANAQTFSIYRTYVSAVDYGRANLRFSNNFVVLEADQAGAGDVSGVTLLAAAGGQVRMFCGGTTGWLIDSGGNFLGATDNTYDIGDSGANRPRNIYCGSLTAELGGVGAAGNVTCGAGNIFYFAGRTSMSSPSDGTMLVQNTAGTDFSRLMFGGTTSSFPALKRSSAVLQARLGDDSLYAGFEAARFGAGGVVSTSTFINIAACTTASSSLRFIQGAAPTSPTDGDMWREDNTNTGLKIRINGVTKTVTVA